MDYKANYKRLLAELETLGGNLGSLRGVSNFYSLENEAKVRQEIKRLRPHPLTPSPKEMGNTQPSPKAPLLGRGGGEDVGERISDFPPELHGVYLERKHVFLQACSLKMQLNAVPMEDENQALSLQQQIVQLFERLDDCTTILDHWTNQKRILKPQTEDFSKLSAMELIKRRNALRSNLVSREKSLQKWKSEAEKLSDKTPLRLKSKILRKTEEIEQIKLTIKELDKLIK